MSTKTVLNEPKCSKREEGDEAPVVLVNENNHSRLSVGLVNAWKSLKAYLTRFYLCLSMLSGLFFYIYNSTMSNLQGNTSLDESNRN